MTTDSPTTTKKVQPQTIIAAAMDLYMLRSKRADAKESYDKLMLAASDVTGYPDIATDVAESEMRLRSLMVQRADETGDKNVAPGFKCRTFTTPIYDDAAALAWCLEKGLHVTYDKKGFVKTAKALPEGDRPAELHILEYCQATIPGNLAKVLDQA